MTTATFESATVAERLAAKTEKTEGCWNWTGATQRGGYGVMRVGGFGSPPARTHRVAYVLAFGPIAEGLEVDHLCGNTRCVRPSHLQAVTPTENRRRTATCACGRCLKCRRRLTQRRYRARRGA